MSRLCKGDGQPHHRWVRFGHGNRSLQLFTLTKKNAVDLSVPDMISVHQPSAPEYNKGSFFADVLAH